MCERRVDAAQGAAFGNDVLDHRRALISINLPRAQDANVVTDFAKSAQGMLEQRLAIQRQRSFVAAHA